MPDQKRVYRKQRRAESEEETRRRIAAGAAELHGTLGPARTSVSAVAERAGVRRSTVYRHFPDEAALFAACTAHWMAANPPPDLASWAATSDPEARLRAGLSELYAYYRSTEQMMANLHRDEETMPIVQQLFSGFRQYLSMAQDTLMAGRRARGAPRQLIAASIGHALAFPTWRSLVREHSLEDAAAADLMYRLVAAAGWQSSR
jgi:AcrR family transcriptional regulator